eukprot:TRINITY_DN26165_c0_g1_i1.p1 TRINITY_DN26165_c0_g1~~TRINITY_DN26165_c0_g1_i1.p1  ORF type:complete len:175 (+),score=49.38 TRINITY_DN26165_c0_g1_i1:37-561(+)
MWEWLFYRYLFFFFFKQKTAYEMQRGLVGSEMCIRDRYQRRVHGLAGADRFVQNLPRGYDTVLEENASNLSGGQKQRLAIARALLTNPRILIFDEATSALDPESEAIIQSNLRDISKGRTVIIISHRLSMVHDADLILVMDNGEKIDLAAHGELLRRPGVYREFWQQQTGWNNK